MSETHASVTAVTCTRGSRPLRAPFRTALRETAILEFVTVELAWSDGSVTSAAVSPVTPVTGETPASVKAVVEGPLAEAVTGVPLGRHEEMFRRLRDGVPGNTTAKCALDLALHEALWLALGGAELSLGVEARPVKSDITVSLGPPEEMASEAVEKAGEGWQTLKLKLGAGDADEEARRVLSVAERVGPDVVLRLDANQAWPAGVALDVLDRLERAGVRPELLEQPVKASDLTGMALVARNSPIPVLADESVHSAADVVRVAEAGAAQLVNIKLAKCGGLRAARDFAATAGACGLGVIVGCMLEPPSTVAAAALLALTLPDTLAHDLDAVWWVGGDERLEAQPPYVRPVTGQPAAW